MVLCKYTDDLVNFVSSQLLNLRYFYLELSAMMLFWNEKDWELGRV